MNTSIKQHILAPNKVNPETKDTMPWMFRELIELPKPEPIERVILANAITHKTKDPNFSMEHSFKCEKVIVGEPIDSLTPEQEAKLETITFNPYYEEAFRFADKNFKEVPIFIANADKTFQAIRPE